jgi:hypothetical protein
MWRKRGVWLLAIGLAAAGALALWLFWGPRPQRDDPGPPGGSNEPYLEQARKALNLGSYRMALAALDQARADLERRNANPAERRRLAHLHRQVALAADLLEVPLQDILRHVQDLVPAEWHAVFAQRYQDRAVLFDAEVVRDESGKLVLNYLLFAAGKEAHVEIGDLQVIQELSLDRPTRMIVGARLAGVDFRDPGRLVVRLRPDSGVLMTDPLILESVCPALKDDTELPAVLKRQEAWLEPGR